MSQVRFSQKEVFNQRRKVATKSQLVKKHVSFEETLGKIMKKYLDDPIVLQAIRQDARDDYKLKTLINATS